MKVFVNGVTYQLEVCGEGFPLLMLHGFTGRGANWAPFCKDIGRSSQLIMPDIIGHGFTRVTDSEYTNQHYQIESVANDMIAIIDHLGYEKVDLLGYSMGGRLALAIAVQYPGRIRNLILESASPGLPTLEERTQRVEADESLANFILNNGVESFVDYWETIPLFKSQDSLPVDVKKSIRQQKLMNDPLELSMSLRGMGTGAQPSYWENLSQVQTKVLLIVGELDNKFCKMAEEMKKKLKNGQIYRVEQAGHAIHVEQPEKFGTIVREFLSNT
jgi:2-succinyl-6-hydroxy-2,4-cyclohexadiene-1-carboxylate synthase